MFKKGLGCFLFLIIALAIVRIMTYMIDFSSVMSEVGWVAAPGFLYNLLVFAIPLGVFVIIFLRLLKSRSSEREGRMGSKEIEILQELNRGFERMEQRIESLETILFEQDGKE